MRSPLKNRLEVGNQPKACYAAEGAATVGSKVGPFCFFLYSLSFLFFILVLRYLV